MVLAVSVPPALSVWLVKVLRLVEVTLATAWGSLAGWGLELLLTSCSGTVYLRLQLVRDSPLVHVLHLCMVLHGHRRYLMVVHGLLQKVGLHLCRLLCLLHSSDFDISASLVCARHCRCLQYLSWDHLGRALHRMGACKRIWAAWDYATHLFVNLLNGGHRCTTVHHGLGCLFRNRSLIARPDVWHHKTLRATQVLPGDNFAVTIIVVRYAITALEARALSAWTKLVRCVLHRVPSLLLILDCDGMLHTTRHLVWVDQASVVSIWRMPTLLRRCHSLEVLLIAQEIFPRGAVKHLLRSLCKSCSSTRLLLF